jgi:small subunit ribosomal protein S16
MVVMDTNAPRDGRALEEVGLYHPIEPEDKQISLKEDRIREWISKGAQPSATVKRILNKHEIYLER